MRPQQTLNICDLLRLEPTFISAWYGNWVRPKFAGRPSRELFTLAIRNYGVKSGGPTFLEVSGQIHRDRQGWAAQNSTRDCEHNCFEFSRTYHDEETSDVDAANVVARGVQDTWRTRAKGYIGTPKAVYSKIRSLKCNHVQKNDDESADFGLCLALL